MIVTIKMSVDDIKEHLTSYGESLKFHEAEYMTNHDKKCTHETRSKLLNKGRLCGCPNIYAPKNRETEFKVLKIEPENTNP